MTALTNEPTLNVLSGEQMSENNLIWLFITVIGMLIGFIARALYDLREDISILHFELKQLERFRDSVFGREEK